MTLHTLYQFLDNVENFEPRLFHVLNGDEARRELEIVTESETVDRIILVAIGEVKQPLLKSYEQDVLDEDADEDITPVVFVTVEKRTALESKPITESLTEQPA